MSILYRNADYLVRYNRVSDDDVAVVAFHPWSHQPGLEGHFFAEKFFHRRGINAVGIIPARNDWYQGSAMQDVIQSVLDATRQMRLVGYGGSMGAYAVINFAEDFQFDDLLAIGPQFSIDPVKVPHETRWTKEAQEITFHNDKIDRITRRAKGWVVYDPRTADARHAGLILVHHDFTPVKLYFAGHHPLTVLQETGLTEQLLFDLVQDRLDKIHFVRSLRQKRRHSAWSWFHLSKELQACRKFRSALRAIEIAKTMHCEDQFPLDVQHAGLLLQANYIEAAIALINPHVDNPTHKDSARFLVSEWQKLLLQQRIPLLLAKIESLENEVAAIRASRSWRITRPLRSVRRIVRR